MNRETLDGIVKQGLVKYADRCLAEVGEFFLDQWSDPYNAKTGLFFDALDKREDALSLLRDDARRLEIVDRILKEMK